MKIGLVHDTISHLGLSARDALDFAVERRLEGVQFSSLALVSPSLDPDQLRDLRVYADRHELYLELGIPSVNPHHAVPTLCDGTDSLVERLSELLERA